jgi:hypothetical protein
MSQALLLKLLPQQQALRAYPLPTSVEETSSLRLQMTEMYELDVAGFAQLYT